MNCPKCGGATNIIDTRPSDKYGPSLYRMRMCWKCGNRFTTYEVTPKILKDGREAKELLSQIRRFVKQMKERSEK